MVSGIESVAASVDDCLDFAPVLAAVERRDEELTGWEFVMFEPVSALGEHADFAMENQSEWFAVLVVSLIIGAVIWVIGYLE